MAGRIRLQASDWLQLLLFMAIAWLAALLVSVLLMPQLLRGPMIEELSIKLEQDLALAEQVLPLLPEDQPGLSGIQLHRGWQPPPGSRSDLGPFGQGLQTHLKRHHGLDRRLALASRATWNAADDVWVQLHATTGAAPIWLRISSRLSSSALFWPLVMLTTALIGTPIGLLVFLQQRLVQPLNQLIQHLPEHPSSTMELVPESGLTPVRAFAMRINRLLDQLNNNAASRLSLLRGLVHDLRGPLTRLSLRLENLESGIDPAGSLVPALRRDADDLKRLSDQLAALASQEVIGAGPQDLALDDLCARIASAYPNGAIDLRVPRELVQLNPELLQRSLNNLIDNALEYGKPPVRLSAERLANAFVIRVEDHGYGLASADLLGRQPLPRADDRQRQQHQGLGLAIVERFCRDHGGRLQLEPSSLGGLKAELQLPLSCLKYAGPERRRRRKRENGDGHGDDDGYGGPDRRGSLWGPRFNARP